MVYEEMSLSSKRTNEVVAPIYIDTVTLEQARDFARNLGAFRAPPPSSTETTNLSKVSDNDQKIESVMSWFEALGIDNIDEEDVYRRWASHEGDEKIIFPIGFVRQEFSKNTSKLVNLNISEVSMGGGQFQLMGQGFTGAGKSFLIEGMALTSMLFYSPKMLNYIFLDFKGGATFQGYGDMPHVVGNISNLDNMEDTLDRFEHILQGEIIRRQTLFDKLSKKLNTGVNGIIAYKREAAPLIRENQTFLNGDPIIDIPYLLIVVDEFGEFIFNHPEYIPVFETVARVGRSLGIGVHLWTQTYTPNLVGQFESGCLMRISLHASSASASSIVIGTPEAHYLPTGFGDAYLKIGDKKIQFGGFNIDEQVEEKLGAKELHFGAQEISDTLETNINQQVKHRQAKSKDLKLFIPLHKTISRKYSKKSEDINDSTDLKKNTDDDNELDRAQTDFAEDNRTLRDDKPELISSHKKMRNLISKKLKSLTEIRARRMWNPSLSLPYTYGGVWQPESVKIDRSILTMFDFDKRSEEFSKKDNLSALVGWTDYPFEHTQKPYRLQFNSNIPHRFIFGSPGIGKSTLIKSLIAYCGYRYDPNRHGFYIIESNVKQSLRDMCTFPNVGSYCVAQDSDYVGRTLLTFQRIISYRSRIFIEKNFNSIDEYLSYKNHLNNGKGDPEDQFGKMILVLDNFDNFLDIYKKKHNTSLIDILSKGGGVGVYVIVSSSTDFTAGISAPDISKYITDQSITAMSFNDSINNKTYRNISDKLVKLNKRVGRFLELESSNSDLITHFGKVVVPQLKIIEPYGYDKDGIPQFATGEGFESGIQEFGNYLADEKKNRCASIETMYKSISFENFYKKISIPLYRKHGLVPLGINNNDLGPLCVLKHFSPNVLAFGGSKSGKTNFIRSMMTSLVQTYSSEEIEIYVADPAQNFLEEIEILERYGYLGGYQSSTDDIEALAGIEKKLRNRLPSSSRERVSWTGKRIFFLIDDYALIAGSMNSSVSTSIRKTLDSFGKIKQDLGISFYISGSQEDFESMRSQNDSSEKRLVTNGATVLLFSGTNKGYATWSEGRELMFEQKRPGLAELFTMRSPAETMDVLIPLTPKWDQKVDPNNFRG